MNAGTYSHFELTESRLDINRLRQDLKHPKSDTTLTFESTVPIDVGEHALDRLDCEVYEELAESAGQQIIQEALEQFGVSDIAIVQRTGRLVPGESLLWIGINTPHFEAGQQAIHYVIQALKDRLPIWQKALFKDGSTAWLTSTTTTATQEEGQPASEQAESTQAEIRQPEPASEETVATIHTNVPDDELVPFHELEEAVNQSQALTPAFYFQDQLAHQGIGLEGQRKLANSKVLIVGAGSLGNAALSYLSGAGVGTIGVCDASRLETEHLHRQPLYVTQDIGKNKALLAAERLQANNPFVQIKVHPKKLERHNAKGLFEAYDIILDCTNQVMSRALLQEAAASFHKPLVQARILQYEGQLHVYQPQTGGCLQCQEALKPEIPSTALTASSTFGAVSGTFGTLQAIEALKLILSLPTPLTESQMVLDLLTYQSRFIQRIRNRDCEACQPYIEPAQVDNAHEEIVHSPIALTPDLDQFEWEVSIHAQDIQRLSNYILVDVSEAREHRPFPNHPCLNLPFSRFNLNSHLLDRDHDYLLYCQKGTRSAHLVRELRGRGYRNIYTLSGGLLSLPFLFQSETPMATKVNQPAEEAPKALEYSLG